MDENTRFHWAEGLKYVSEGIKALLYLNGAAAISILTFVGNFKSGDDRFVYALFCFSVGALMGPVTYFSAYLTQLKYGNDTFDEAWWYHGVTYACFVAAILFFLVGVGFAGFAFLDISDSS